MYKCTRMANLNRTRLFASIVLAPTLIMAWIWAVVVFHPLHGPAIVIPTASVGLVIFTYMTALNYMKIVYVPESEPMVPEHVDLQATDAPAADSQRSSRPLRCLRVFGFLSSPN